MLERIFGLLSLEDLAAVVLVCQRWRQAGEAPRLWAGIQLEVNSGNMESVPGLLKSRRFQTLTSLMIVSWSTTVLQAVAEHDGLKKLVIIGEDYVRPFEEFEELANTFVKVEEGHIICNSFGLRRLQFFLEAIRHDSKIKRFKVHFLSGVWCSPRLEAGTLTQAVKHLEEMDMTGIQFTSLCNHELFTAVSGKDNNIRKLAIGFPNYLAGTDILEGVEGSLLAKAVMKLEEFSMTQTTKMDKFDDMLKAIVKSESKLKKLTVTNINITHAFSSPPTHQDPVLLAKAINKLEEATLETLNEAQAKAILIQCVKDTCLKKLNIHVRGLTDKNLIQQISKNTGCVVCYTEE
jgi:hypothetical protein